MGLFDRRRRIDLHWTYEAREGDRIVLAGSELVVRGHIVFDEDGYRWVEMRMVDEAGGSWWLSVQLDDGWKVVLWEPTRAADLLRGPTDRRIAHRGTTYTRSETGTATYHARYDTGLAASGRVEYADYEAAGGRLLSFERFGSHTAASRPVDPGGSCTQCGAPMNLDAGGCCSYCGTPPASGAEGWHGWEVYTGEPVDPDLVARG